MDIRLINLKKDYPSTQNKRVPALRGINLDINSGNYMCFVGPSGSGKSTLLNCLTGITRPTSGDVHWGKVSLKKSGDNEISKLRRQQIGIVAQYPRFFPELNVKENILLPLSINTIDIMKKTEYYKTLLKKFKIESLQHRKPYELSGGEQKKVSIVRALISNPSFLIADEPTSNLDEDSSNEVFSILYNLNEMGLTVIVATHDERFAKYAKETYFLENGRIVSFGENK